jgi:hypothetical protein
MGGAAGWGVGACHRNLAAKAVTTTVLHYGGTQGPQPRLHVVRVPTEVIGLQNWWEGVEEVQVCTKGGRDTGSCK